jgi:hypothetical protein
MTVVSGLLGKAQNLLGAAITRKTKVYDASKNKFYVAGMLLDGVVSVELSVDLISRSDVGVSRDYYAYYDTFDNLKATVTVLPTAQCIDMLKTLAKDQLSFRGWVSITVYDNGELVGQFRGHLMSGAGIMQSQQADDRAFEFGLLEVGTKIVSNIFSESSTG